MNYENELLDPTKRRKTDAEAAQASAMRAAGVNLAAEASRPAIGRVEPENQAPQLAVPGNPNASGMGQDKRPKSIDIGGIKHMDLGSEQKFPSPFGIAAQAAGGTIAHMVTAPFGNRAAAYQEQARAGLDSSAEVAALEKPQGNAATRGIMNAPKNVVAPNTLESSQADRMLFGNLNQLEDKGGGIIREVAANNKTTLTNVGTKDVTAPGKKVADQSFDGNAVNGILAGANKARGEMIDYMVKAQGGNGVAVLKDRNAEWNDQMRRQGEIQQITDAMARNPLLANAMSGALTQTVAGQKQQASDAMRQKGIMAGLDVQRRGQDIQAQTDAAKLAGSPIDNQLKAAKLSGILADTGNTVAMSRTRNQLASETDPAKRTELMSQLLALQGVDTERGRFVKVGGGDEVDEGGARIRRPDVVLDSRTGEVATKQSTQNPLPESHLESIAKANDITVGDVRTRYSMHRGGWSPKSISELTPLDVQLGLAMGAQPEKIAATVKRLGGKPSDFGLAN